MGEISVSEIIITQLRDTLTAELSFTHTLKGSRGSDVKVILNVTLDLMKQMGYVV